MLCGGLLWGGGVRAEVGVLPTGDAALTAALHEGARTTSDEPVMDDERLASQIEAAEGLGVTCEARAPECLARLAGLASLSAIVVTRIDGDTLVLTLVDAGEKAVVARAAGAIGESRAKTARELAARLFTTAAREARLRVTVTPDDARVTVGGKDHRTGEPVAVAPGRHTVRAERTGFVAVERELEVGLGDAVDVELTLSALAGRAPAASIEEPAPLPILLWVGVGGAAAGAAVTAVGAGGLLTGGVLAEVPTVPNSVRQPLDLWRGPLVITTLAGASVLAVGGVLIGIALLTDP